MAMKIAAEDECKHHFEELKYRKGDIRSLTYKIDKKGGS